MTFLLTFAAALAAVLLIIAAVSRHKKSSSSPVSVMGKHGRVYGKLDPEGFVIVQGELLPAVTADGQTLKDGNRVIVFATRGNRLVVQSAAKEELNEDW
jgi:membrane-bound ClpP family serine protease